MKLLNLGVIQSVCWWYSYKDCGFTLHRGNRNPFFMWLRTPNAVLIRLNLKVLIPQNVFVARKVSK